MPSSFSAQHSRRLPVIPKISTKSAATPSYLNLRTWPYFMPRARANDFHPGFKKMKPVGVNSVATQEGPLQ